MKRISYTLGILIAIGSLAGSIYYLKQPLSSFFDPVALMGVFGGTLAVSVITLPIHHIREIFGLLRSLFSPLRLEQTECVKNAIQILVQRQWAQAETTGLRGLPKQILKEGIELMELEFSVDKIRTILDARIETDIRQKKRLALALKSLAKYPPAFGLIGTVLGLVNLMRQISAGLEAKQTGVEMSIALIATLYGLLLSNLLIAPAGEAILRHALDEQENAEIIIQGIILTAEGSSMLEAQEVLNSYVHKVQRTNVLDTSQEAA